MQPPVPTPDEQWLIDRCRQGLIADFTERDGNATRRPSISASLIRRLLLGQPDVDGSTVPLPLGLQVRGALIQGALQLANLGGAYGEGCSAPLSFQDCRFDSGTPCPAPQERVEPTIDLRHARCSRLAFVDCAVAKIALDEARIAGDLDLTGLHSIGTDAQQCWLSAEGVRVAGTLRLSRARLRLEPADTPPPIDSKPSRSACNLGGGIVEGNLIATDGFTVSGGLALPHVVGGNVDLSGARLRCASRPRGDGIALLAGSCEIGGNMLLRPQERHHDVLPFECHGVVDFYGLKVSGSIDFSGGTFSGPEGDDADPPIRCFAMEVRGAVILQSWRPRQPSTQDGETRPAVVRGREVLFSQASVGRSMFVELADGDGAAPLNFDGLCVSGELRIFDARGSCNLKSLRVGGDLTISAGDGAEPRVDVTDSSVGGNLWLRGKFAYVRAWGCSVQGQFGGFDYTADRVVAPECRIQGQSHFAASDVVDIRAAKLTAGARVVSLARPPGIAVEASGLTADQDVVTEGKLRSLDLSMSTIGGRLQAGACSVNVATFEGMRVRGGARLPQHVFGAVSLNGARIDGPLDLGEMRLHLRRRPSGQTAPSIDLRDVRIDGDLLLDRVERSPATGIIEESNGTPPWLSDADAILRTGWFLRRTPSFYRNVDIVELHVPRPGSDPQGPSEVECHAFLVQRNGQTVYLNGQSQAIHLFNQTRNGRSPLDLSRTDQALDYLRFFGGYVWGEDGAFIIVDSLEPSEWLQYQERDEARLAAAPVPPVMQREGSEWVAKVVVQYSDYLFVANMRIADTGVVTMTDDEQIATLRQQGVTYPQPDRRYWLDHDAPPRLPGQGAPGASPEPAEQSVAGEKVLHRSLQEVIRDGRWSAVTSDDARAAVLHRIRDELSETRKQQVAVQNELRVLVDLRGCQCGTLEDDNGKGWGPGLSADLRGFEYQELAEGGSGRSRQANEAFAEPGAIRADTVGPSLGSARSDWLERVTKGLDFSVAPYEQLVRALARRGDPDAARAVLERRLQCENQRRPRITRFCIWAAVQVPFRYGLFSKRGIASTLLYWVLGIVAFDIANYGALRVPPVAAKGSQLVTYEIPLPLQPVLMVDSQPVTMTVTNTASGDKPVTVKLPNTADLAEEVACGDQVEPSLYALDTMLPLVDLHQESKCGISSADGWGPLAWRIFRALYAVGGAYMTSMLLLTVSGVLRRSTER